MQPIWNGKEVASATSGRLYRDFAAMRVVIDSRDVQPGDLFVAIRGERFDGHNFAAEAMGRGAAGLVLDHLPPALPADAPYVLVPDTMHGLRHLARAARARSSARILAVTGSVGKTGTKEMLAHALSSQGKVYATRGNFNNHIGLPLTLANLPEDACYAVFELGMNHAGEIEPLSRMVKPHVSIITTVEAVHIEFFDSVAGIADAKAEIFSGMNEGGIAVLNADNAHYGQLAQRASEAGLTDIRSFGTGEQAHARLLEYHADADGSTLAVALGEQRIPMRLGTVGRHWGMTAAAVLAACEAVGAEARRAARALASFREPAGRGRVEMLPWGSGGITLIDDSYNASPASMRAGFSKLAELGDALGQGRRVAVLGDMLELGDTAPAEHAGLLPALMEAGVTQLFTAGPLMRGLHEAAQGKAIHAVHAGSAAELMPFLLAGLEAGDVVLAKGSHGSHIYQLVEQLRETAAANAPRERARAV